MAKRRVHDPETGKIRWIDDGAGASGTTPNGAATPAAPSSSSSESPPSKPRPGKSAWGDWNNLFRGSRQPDPTD